MMRHALAEKTAMKSLARAVTFGSLTIQTPAGRTETFAGSRPGPSATIEIRDWRTLDAVLAKGDIGLGEAYMSGWWDSDDLEAFLAFTIVNMDGLGRLAWGSLLFRLKSLFSNRLWRRNSEAGARRNISAHYDLGNAFYALWLDASMSYSSGIYREDGAKLEDAQHAKYQRIIDLIGSGERVLEIGCGWGGFIAQATAQGRHVTAHTISRQQYEWVQQRQNERLDLKLEDYRRSSGRYPAIVSIEMLEAVGERYWPIYFATLRQRLTDRGTAVIQTITIRDDLFASYRTCSDYIRHHIFPGGMLPSLRRFTEEAHAARLDVTDVYSFGGDYARTLHDWRDRFETNLPGIRGLGYDEPFVRGWRLYLAMCASAFSLGRIDVKQITLQPA